MSGTTGLATGLATAAPLPVLVDENVIDAAINEPNNKKKRSMHLFLYCVHPVPICVCESAVNVPMDHDKLELDLRHRNACKKNFNAYIKELQNCGHDSELQKIHVCLQSKLKSLLASINAIPPDYHMRGRNKNNKNLDKHPWFKFWIWSKCYADEAAYDVETLMLAYEVCEKLFDLEQVFATDVDAFRPLGMLKSKCVNNMLAGLRYLTSKLTFDGEVMYTVSVYITIFSLYYY